MPVGQGLGLHDGVIGVVGVRTGGCRVVAGQATFNSNVPVPNKIPVAHTMQPIACVFSAAPVPVQQVRALGDGKSSSNGYNGDSVILIAVAVI